MTPPMCMWALSSSCSSSRKVASSAERWSDIVRDARARGVGRRPQRLLTSRRRTTGSRWLGVSGDAIETPVELRDHLVADLGGQTIRAHDDVRSRGDLIQGLELPLEPPCDLG